MKTITGMLVSVVFISCGFLFAGCNPKQKISLRYQRPAEIQIPASIKRVGIASFGGDTAKDRKWGSVASDHLAAALEEQNLKEKRYSLVDRMRLKAILDQRDLQLAVCDSESAGKVAKLADVHAMIYGSVKTTTNQSRERKKTFDIMSRRMKTVHYTRYYCMATVNFTLDDISTGRALATSTASRTYDSKKEGSRFAALTGIGGSDDGQGKMDEIVIALIDECIQEFLAKICSHEVVITVTLGGGKSKIVSEGNKFAAVGDYSDALERYQAGISTNPGDHECVFNAGVMYEALGEFAKAEEKYERALKIEPKEQYIQARKRVRVESSR